MTITNVSLRNATFRWHSSAPTYQQIDSLSACNRQELVLSALTIITTLIC